MQNKRIDTFIMGMAVVFMGAESSSWDCCPGWDARMRRP